MSRRRFNGHQRIQGAVVYPELTVLSVALQKSCGAVFPTSRAPRRPPRAPSPSRTVAAVSPTYKCRTALLDTRASLPVSTLSQTHIHWNPLYCRNAQLYAAAAQMITFSTETTASDVTNRNTKGCVICCESLWCGSPAAPSGCACSTMTGLLVVPWLDCLGMLVVFDGVLL